MDHVKTKVEVPLLAQTLFGFAISALVLIGISGSIYKLVAPEGWVVQAFGHSFGLGASLLAAVLGAAALVWCWAASDHADYVETGYWSRKCVAEAQRFCKVHIAASGEQTGFDRIPDPREWQVSSGAAYTHITGNETADGVEYPRNCTTLDYTPKDAARVVRKVLKSAVANAEHNLKADHAEEFRVAAVLVDGGPMLKRFRPRAQGRAAKIWKRTSHISVVLRDGV